MFYLSASASVLLGLLLATAAVHRLPHRLPRAGVVLPTGAVGALAGALITQAALAPAEAAPLLLGAAALSAASVSLLLRTGRTPRRGAAAGNPAA
ncbi:hypothetical protein [Streptomyces sp. NPDC005012]|uniref:hypothetical protein n=1 Tax=Streptomyces sp. NPDC005012 TaxID=3154558 RepID=UPI0033B21660